MIRLIILFLLSFGILSSETTQDKIGFTVKHKFKTVNGKVQKFSINNLSLKKEANRYSAQPFSIQFKLVDMRTGDPNRDSHMLEVLGYPEQESIELQITKVEEIKPKEEYKIYLDAKINGVTQSLESIATTVEKEGKVQIKGQLKILLDQFKIKAPSLLFFPIENVVVCEYEFNV